MRRCSVMVRQRGGIVVVSSPIARRHWVIITNRWCVKHSWIMWSTRTNSLTHILRLRLSSVDRRIRHWLRYFCAKIIVAHSDVCDDVVCRGGRASPSATPRTVWETAGFGSHYTAFRTNQKLPKLTHTYTTTPTLNSIKSISIHANTITWRIYIACSHYINLCGCGCVCVCLAADYGQCCASTFDPFKWVAAATHTRYLLASTRACGAHHGAAKSRGDHSPTNTHTHTHHMSFYIYIHIYIYIFGLETGGRHIFFAHKYGTSRVKLLVCCDGVMLWISETHTSWCGRAGHISAESLVFLVRCDGIR